MATIFFAGSYGVGKSTLCNALSNRTGIPFFSAGDLISQVNGEKYGATKFVSDKDKNQDILAESICSILKRVNTIFLAGHFCIINKAGEIDVLPESIFQKLVISQVILLEANPEVIIKNLEKRDKITYTFSLISNLIRSERQSAQHIAAQLICPLHIYQMQYSSQDVNSILSFF